MIMSNRDRLPIATTHLCSRLPHVPTRAARRAGGHWTHL